MKLHRVLEKLKEFMIPCQKCLALAQHRAKMVVWVCGYKICDYRRLYGDDPSGVKKN